MSANNEKLAQSLEKLYQLQKQGKTAIRSADLARTHRERKGYIIMVSCKSKN